MLEDVARSARDYRDGVEFDPEALEQDQERMSALQGLLRRIWPAHGMTYWRRAMRRPTLVSAVDDAAERERAARKKVDAAEQKLASAAQALDQARRTAAPQFAEQVTAQMSRLEMGGAELLCEVRPLPRESWTQAGPSEVEFLFRPGAGMQARPLARIASGGEVSRVMLAIKVVLGQADSVDTLVFDEVDAGVGGSTAVALADVLVDLARTHQVIVVTHLAQVAVRGNAHYTVNKVAGSRWQAANEFAAAFPPSSARPRLLACCQAMPRKLRLLMRARCLKLPQGLSVTQRLAARVSRMACFP